MENAEESYVMLHRESASHVQYLLSIIKHILLNSADRHLILKLFNQLKEPATGPRDFAINRAREFLQD